MHHIKLTASLKIHINKLITYLTSHNAANNIIRPKQPEVVSYLKQLEKESVERVELHFPFFAMLHRITKPEVVT